MRISTIGYSIKESFKNLWRNRVMSVASISSVAATLLILGLVFVLIINITSLSNSAKDQFDTIQVFLLDSTEMDQIEDIGTQILALEGVEDIYFETKEEAMEKMMADWGENAYLLEGLESNPLPNSYIIILDDIAYSEYVVGMVSQIDGIEEVRFYQDIIDSVMSITDFIRRIGLIIIVILIGISTFIINNTVKIAVNGRRREINIMKYVGATNWFIRWPFLIEGTILGFIGAIISLGIVYFSYGYVLELISNQFFVMFTPYIVDLSTVVGDLMVIFIVIGSGIGALGSLLSMRQYLKV